MNSIQRQARIAGLWYLLVGVTAPIAFLYVPGQLIVPGDATATADRIRASEWLFRIGIGCELFHQVIAVFLVLALYRLFHAVNEKQAVLMVILGALVSVPVAFANVLNQLAALILLGGAGFLSVFEKAELEALAYFFLRLHGRGLDVVSIFWGLWLFPFGALVIRSGFIPRVFGVLMMIAGAGYLANSFTSLVLPQYEALVGRYALLLEMGELPIMFWLLIWGARVRSSEPAADA